MTLGPWTRGDVLDLHILILLIIWFILDRCDIYVADWVVKDRLNRLADKLFRAWKQICTRDFWVGK